MPSKLEWSQKCPRAVECWRSSSNICRWFTNAKKKSENASSNTGGEWMVRIQCSDNKCNKIREHRWSCETRQCQRVWRGVCKQQQHHLDLDSNNEQVCAWAYWLYIAQESPNLLAFECTEGPHGGMLVVIFAGAVVCQCNIAFPRLWHQCFEVTPFYMRNIVLSNKRSWKCCSNSVPAL